MSVNTPKLWCACPSLPPGTIKLEWRGKTGPDAILFSGNEADSVMEQFRAFPSDKERQQFLTGLIDTARGAA